MDPVCGGNCRERIRHPDLIRRGIQHERMRVVQLPPALRHVAGVSEFRRDRRTPEVDERGVCAVAKVDQLRVNVLEITEALIGAARGRP
jgi:hypothetical protein